MKILWAILILSFPYFGVFQCTFKFSVFLLKVGGSLFTSDLMDYQKEIE